MEGMSFHTETKLSSKKGEHKERIHEGGRERGGGEEMERIMMKTMRGADADKRRMMMLMMMRRKDQLG
ncbi:Hypothetical predicted protein [Xyrichtys novacula]|uniref:Uncharacterized protein n=1 Tax=Xyrichtys novacula TaxID=13765 RepID=A0AAV1HRV9_XYRNO|nr:Hypothetical predicted protein [Xyrichtys novacula]